jgi:hypothetical protein
MFGLKHIPDIERQHYELQQKFAAATTTLLTNGQSLVHSGTHWDEKISAALVSIQQLSSLVEELQSARLDATKVAAALAGATKLASEGVIDPDQIFQEAARHLEDGPAKIAQVIEQPLPVVGGSVAEGSTLDPLTQTLRTLSAQRAR